MNISITILLFAVCSALALEVVAQQPAAQNGVIRLGQSLTKDLASHEQLVITDFETETVKVRKWADFLEPTFPLNFHYNEAIRVVVRDNKLKHSYAIFAFTKPSDLSATFPIFQRIEVSGILKSKVLTYFSALGTSDVFVILLSEQKPMTSETAILALMPKILYQSATSDHVNSISPNSQGTAPK